MKINKQSNILFIIHSLGLGGQEKQLVELVIGLEKQLNPYVIVLQRNGKREEYLKKNGVPVITIENRKIPIFFRLYNIFTYCKIIQPIVVHGWGITAGFYASIMKLCGIVPVAMSSMNSGMELRSVMTKGSGRFFFNYFIPFFQKLFSYYLYRVICNSESGKKYITEVCKVTKNKVLTIPNGLDFKIMEKNMKNNVGLRKILNVSDTTPIVGFIGKLDYNKDPMTFLKAAVRVREKIRNVSFVMIASGPLMEEVDTFINDNNINNGFFILNQRPDAPLLAREFNIGVLSSCSEGLPNVILEYMYWSIPCIVTNAGDSGIVVKHNSTGIVVPIGDYHSLSLAMIEILNNPEKANRMGFEGRKRLEKFYNINRYVDDYYKLYSNI